MTGPLVTVIVPVWNGEETLQETLRSAAAQTHRNVEILIIDDGSTDRTPSIAAEFCASDPRSRLIRMERGGLASARNKGIDEARGDYIAPLDADDLWHPEKIERQLKTFAAGTDSLALVYCWYRMIDAEGRVTEKPWAPVLEGSIFDEHLQLNFGTGSSPLISRRLLGRLRYSAELTTSETGGNEDWLLQLQLASRFQIGCTRAFLLGYRLRPDSMSADIGRMILAHIRMYEIILRDFPGASRATVERELERWRSSNGQATITQRFRRAISDMLRPRHPSVGKRFFALSPDVP